MKRVYIIRHAETEASVQDIMAGPDLDTPLTDKGRAQAKQAGQLLKDKGIELMMVSPMDRTRETASIIAREIGLDASKLVESDLVLERDFGKYSGKPYTDYVSALRENRLDQSQLEPLDKLHDRVSKAFEWLADRQESVILVVSHGSTARMFRVVDRQLAKDDFHEMAHFANAEIDEFTL